MSNTAEEAHQTLLKFLANAVQPVIIEQGRDPLPIVAGSYSIELSGGRLFLQAWSETENLSRCITAVEVRKSDYIEFAVERFGKRIGVLQVYDAARPKTARMNLKASRQSYREQFRRSLLRQFPGWKVVELSTEPDLEHSLSPAYPRALLSKGSKSQAAIGCPPEAIDVDGVVTFGLIWLDYLRRRDRDRKILGLAVFVPVERSRPTCLRMLHLSDTYGEWSVYVYTDRAEHCADLHDYGNLDTTLPPRPGNPTGELEWWMRRLSTVPDVTEREESGGRRSWTVRGLEFARWTPSEGLIFGIETKYVGRESNATEIEALARELARMRAVDAADSLNRLYLKKPELWLEHQVCGNLTGVDASLLPRPLYRQAPAFAGGERGLLDLLAVDHAGRLAVVEVKASEDLHLPLQALDYWIRVRWHAENGDFSRAGFFPGITLRPDAPRLLLVAPALHFHPTTEAVIRSFAPEIEVETIGVGMDWRRDFKVMFRKRRGVRPS